MKELDSSIACIAAGLPSFKILGAFAPFLFLCKNVGGSLNGGKMDWVTFLIGIIIAIVLVGDILMIFHPLGKGQKNNEPNCAVKIFSVYYTIGDWCHRLCFIEANSETDAEEIIKNKVPSAKIISVSASSREEARSIHFP